MACLGSVLSTTHCSALQDRGKWNTHSIKQGWNTHSIKQGWNTHSIKQGWNTHSIKQGKISSSYHQKVL